MNCQYFAIAGITFQISADLPFKTDTFNQKLRLFSAPGPGADLIRVHYRFSFTQAPHIGKGQLVYDGLPWRVYRLEVGWRYEGYSVEATGSPYLIATADTTHRGIEVFFPDSQTFERGDLSVLTLIPSDQIVLAPLLAQRSGVCLHSSGLIFHNVGLLFLGHSGAGKSTMIKLLRDEGEILCDDRIIVRCWPEGVKIHGNWNHGEIPDISPASAPLRAMFFLEKAPFNRITPVSPAEAMRRLPELVIKTIPDRDWWVKTLDTLGQVAREVPAYRIQFDKTGQIKDLLRSLVDGG